MLHIGKKMICKNYDKPNHIDWIASGKLCLFIYTPMWVVVLIVLLANP